MTSWHTYTNKNQNTKSNNYKPRKECSPETTNTKEMLTTKLFKVTKQPTNSK